MKASAQSKRIYMYMFMSKLYLKKCHSVYVIIGEKKIAIIIFHIIETPCSNLPQLGSKMNVKEYNDTEIMHMYIWTQHYIEP